MRFSIHTNEGLVFRDGKPFGSEGAFGGTGFNWVMPQTLTGMVRSSVGFKRDKNYFNSEANQKEILKVGVHKIINTVTIDGKTILLTPIPADMIFTGERDSLNVHLAKFTELKNGMGTDIKNKDWLYPIPDTQEKPSKKIPSQLFWTFFEDYLKEALLAKSNYKFVNVGLGAPAADVRIHNGIDPQTFTTLEGKLFSNKNVYLWAKHGENERNQKFVPLQISFDAVGLQNNEKEDILTGALFLGGERRTVHCDLPKTAFPENQYDFKGKQFLKLVLMTHGSFGSWCPEWLMPDLKAPSISFRMIPNTNLSIRLRSACLNGWEGISGWDYSKKSKNSNGAPKAMKKVVKPGAVYLIEVENPSQSEEVAKYFWGNSLSEGEEKMSGFGLVLVTNVDKQINK